MKILKFRLWHLFWKVYGLVRVTLEGRGHYTETRVMKILFNIKECPMSFLQFVRENRPVTAA
jgi:hypothetical protein